MSISEPPTPPQATYSLTVQVQLEGVIAPMAITASSVNEVKKALRLLAANGLLTAQSSNNGKLERVSTCRSCGAEIAWKERNGKRHPYDVVNGQPTDQSHFRSCPDADQWRTKREAA